MATYTRISTDEEHQPYSLEAQATRLGSYIASQEGWERITVDSRASIRPTFRFPTALTREDGRVRALARSAPLVSLFSNQAWLDSLGKLLQEADRRAS